MLKKLFLLTLSCAPLLLRAADDYPLGPDSKPQTGVPSGRLERFAFTNSTNFPGTSRDCWVYVPAQYDAAKPAALMVFQDGQSYVGTNSQLRGTVVLENLIHRGEMPVTIGLFVSPGSRGIGAARSSNRSFEYDSLGDAYARFLINELIPHVTNTYQLNITSDPNQRGLCGQSSGGIAAFTVAWERPDQFRKVISFIGSFANIRGGDVYPALIRKTERKPLRVFLHDGTNDLNNLHGDWPLSNQQMASALRFSGYDHKLVLGDGGHNTRHAGALLPDAMRWLWRPAEPLPQPLTKDNLGGDEALSKVLPNEGGWELVGEGYGFTDAACSDAEGNFFFCDMNKGAIYRVDLAGKVTLWLENGVRISGMKFGPDGRLYAASQGTVTDRNAPKKIIAIDPQTKQTTDLAVNVQPNDLIVSKAGWIYYTDTGAGQVKRLQTSAKPDAPPLVATIGINRPNGISLSADQNFLVVSEYGGTGVWSYAIAEDGSLQAGERYMELRTPIGRADSGGDGMTTDAQSRYWITSNVGVQMFDWTGRLGGVLLRPQEKGSVSCAFAGPERSYFYVCSSDKVYRRKTLTKGAALGW